MPAPHEKIVDKKWLKVRRIDLKDAARLAVQGGCAAAAFYGLMTVLGLDEKFVGVLSAVLVVEPSKGSTLDRARERFFATVVGSAVGLLAMIALPYGVGTIVALAISVGLMHALAVLRPDWRYGVVAAVALALGSEESAMATAGARCLSIAIGVLVGSIVSFLVWPEAAEARAKRFLSASLQEVAARLKIAADGLQGERKEEDAARAMRDYHRCISQAREAIDAVNFNSSANLRKRRDAVERTYNSVIILNRVDARRENPDEDAVSQSLDEVGDVIDTAYELVLEVADGGRCDAERLERLEEPLRSVRQEDRQGDGAGRTETQALVFAILEIQKSLTVLCEIYEEGESEN